MVECRTAAARRASGRVSSASTPITLITTMSAFSLVPKPSREARVTGSVPRGTACSQMPYVVPPSAVAHQVTAIDQLTVAVKTATTVHATSSQDWPSRAGVVSRRRTPSPRSAGEVLRVDHRRGQQPAQPPSFEVGEGARRQQPECQEGQADQQHREAGADRDEHHHEHHRGDGEREAGQRVGAVATEPSPPGG